VTGFIGPELPDVLALADVVISRSGAGTIAELTALGKASVLIPLPTSAGDEQRGRVNPIWPPLLLWFGST
jgi:UDP-N-acetylglucosamine--N-acetylmuramyl-(pentapeptide) pyrophosphoryl-undecaprenol N-acetylglucosamine transferase